MSQDESGTNDRVIVVGIRDLGTYSQARQEGTSAVDLEAYEIVAMQVLQAVAEFLRYDKLDSRAVLTSRLVADRRWFVHASAGLRRAHDCTMRFCVHSLVSAVQDVGAVWWSGDLIVTVFDRNGIVHLRETFGFGFPDNELPSIWRFHNSTIGEVLAGLELLDLSRYHLTG